MWEAWGLLERPGWPMTHAGQGEVQLPAVGLAPLSCHGIRANIRPLFPRAALVARNSRGHAPN